MILVNNAGDGPSAYPLLHHAKWNGWTPADLVFPFFLFIVGAAMAFSFRSRVERGDRRIELLQHVLRRGFLLLAMGIFLNGFPDHYQVVTLRVYGVLQRIALCYAAVAVLELWLDWRGQVATVVVCLAGYWILLRYFPVPGFGVPGSDIPFLDPERNLAAWFDRKLLLGHLYDGTRDPEGLLSTIPAVATTLLGLLTGKWIRRIQSDGMKVAGMLAFGLAAVALAKVLNRWFPINKNLWTSSFVLLTAGLAIFALAGFFWVLDRKNSPERWTMPFLVFARNSIAAYVFSELVASSLLRLTVRSPEGGMCWQEIIYERLFLPFASPPNASLLYALGYMFACWAAILVLYRRGIFLKI